MAVVSGVPGTSFSLGWLPHPTDFLAAEQYPFLTPQTLSFMAVPKGVTLFVPFFDRSVAFGLSLVGINLFSNTGLF